MRHHQGERKQRMGRMVGYARVSTSEQDIRLQWEALRQAGCQAQHIFCDTASGALTARPGLETCLQVVEPGDILVVWRLDRLGRSMAHLVTVIEGLRQRQVGFRSLGDGTIDTTTASGELIFHLFSALAQFERRLIQERTQAGLATARARGRRGGRRTLQPTDAKVQLAYTMYSDHQWTIEELCATLGISRATCYRYVALARRAGAHA